jgi:hypothetical protein
MSFVQVVSRNDSHRWVVCHFNNVRVDIKELLFIYSAFSMTQMIVKNTIMYRLNFCLLSNKRYILEMIDLIDNKSSSFILLDLRNIIKQMIADILLVIYSIWASRKISHSFNKFIDFIDFLVMAELFMRLVLCSLK